MLQYCRKVIQLRSKPVARVNALTMANVKATTGEVINDQNHALAAIGGIHKLPKYNWIRCTPKCCGTREMFDRVEKRSIGWTGQC